MLVFVRSYLPLIALEDLQTRSEKIGNPYVRWVDQNVMPLQLVVGAVILLGAVNMTLRNEKVKKWITAFALILISYGYT